MDYDRGYFDDELAARADREPLGARKCYPVSE